MLGCCTPDALCVIHRGGMFESLRGTAATRGEVADTVASKLPRMIGKPWPQTVRMRSIARRKVADIADDMALLEMLAASSRAGRLDAGLLFVSRHRRSIAALVVDNL